MKNTTMTTKSSAAFPIAYEAKIQVVALAALVLSGATQAEATLMAISFDDGGINVGSGAIDVENGYAVSGDFVVTAGLATGEWTLTGGTPSSPGGGLSADGFFNYDNMVFLDTDPYLTSAGGLLFTNGLGDDLNIWANAPDTYCMWAVNSSGDYYVEAGSFPGYSGTSSSGTSTITNAPPSVSGGASLPASPTLSIQPAANVITLSWPDSGIAFRVLQNADLTTTNWIANTNAISLVNGTNQVAISPDSGSMFFQLVNP